MSVVDRIPLQHSVAVVREHSVVVRPARSRLVVPLLQALVAVGSALLMVFVLNTGGSLVILVILLMIALLMGPSAVLGLVYGLVGSNVTIEGKKESIRFQQGFLGLGIGTAETVPFSRIKRIQVDGDYSQRLIDGEMPDYVHWEIQLVKDNDRVLDVGQVVVPRFFAEEGLGRANRLARSVADVAGASVDTAELPLQHDQEVDVEENVAMNRPRRRVAPRRGLPAPNEVETKRSGDEEIVMDHATELIGAAKTIAVVGVSAKPERDSHEVAKYLIDAGYEVYLVNPREQRILDRTVYARVQDLPEPVDIVDIFRRPSDVPEVVEDAIEAGAKAVWMQLEIVNDEAADRARNAGLEVVMDRCTKIEHERLVQNHTGG